MFSYFEANVHGTVPNEFEWPVTRAWVQSLAATATEKARALGLTAAGQNGGKSGGKEMNGSAGKNGVRKQRHRR